MVLGAEAAGHKNTPAQQTFRIGQNARLGCLTVCDIGIGIKALFNLPRLWNLEGLDKLNLA